MIPPRAEGKDEPFLLLLNGAKLIPLNLSWAILLANFMAALESFFTESDNAPDREVEQADWERLAEEAVTATRSVYPRTKPEQLREDLALLMESLIAIARGHVQSGKRLIHENDLRRCENRAQDRDTPLHAAGEFTDLRNTRTSFLWVM